ncbi:hypothetical protein BH11PSE9_BH11PSE9_06000 [soil metagenome]
MFARLESNLPRLPRWASTTLRYRFGKTLDNRFYGISYFAVDGEVEAALLGILPAPLRPHFLCSYLVANYHDIPPHIDNGILISLNYYVLTAEATTTFYRFREPRPPVEQLENNDPGSASGLYRRQDLDAAGSFCAKAHELWALDVTQPHDVVSDGSHGDREAYCLQSRAVGFEQLLGPARR